MSPFGFGVMAVQEIHGDGVFSGCFLITSSFTMVLMAFWACSLRWWGISLWRTFTGFTLDQCAMWLGEFLIYQDQINFQENLSISTIYHSFYDLPNVYWSSLLVLYWVVIMSSCRALSPDRMDWQKSDSICHSTGTELSKCYGASSYTLNLTVLLQGFILVCVGTIQSIRSHIFFFCLCCATDTNSSICVRDDILNMIIYNLYFEVFFWWMLDCSVGFLDCCVGLIWKRLTLYVCSSLSNAVLSSCLFNLHILQHTSAICPF